MLITFILRSVLGICLLFQIWVLNYIGYSLITPMALTHAYAFGWFSIPRYQPPVVHDPGGLLEYHATIDLGNELSIAWICLFSISVLTRQAFDFCCHFLHCLCREVCSSHRSVPVLPRQLLQSCLGKMEYVS